MKAAPASRMRSATSSGGLLIYFSCGDWPSSDKESNGLKAADTLAGACPAETALTPVGRMDAMRKRLAAVRAATAAIRPALMHFYEALDQGQKVRFAGMS